jgi:hypothetical protein
MSEITDNTPTIELRNLPLDDYLHLQEAMQEAYDQIAKLLNIFPEGQFCVAVE